jgi:deoxyribodipyrimidine photolyase-like uncharacterized protein
METFYRYMRKKHNVLMENGKPAGGEWNYDRLNRNKYDGKIALPPHPEVRNDATEVLKDIHDANIPHFGSIDEKAFAWPVHRRQSLVMLDRFLRYAIQWLEITNTRGMSQYADGGIIASNPYISSSNYIDKMSDYCNNCLYDKNKKTGWGACSFNSL